MKGRERRGPRRAGRPRLPSSLPRHGICPLGQGTVPLEGTVDDAFHLWVPVKDADNEWVNLGKAGKCVRYSPARGRSATRRTGARPAGRRTTAVIRTAGSGGKTTTTMTTSLRSRRRGQRGGCRGRRQRRCGRGGGGGPRTEDRPYMDIIIANKLKIIMHNRLHMHWLHVISHS